MVVYEKGKDTPLKRKKFCCSSCTKRGEERQENKGKKIKKISKGLVKRLGKMKENYTGVVLIDTPVKCYHF